jgi:hypothetical protein
MSSWWLHHQLETNSIDLNISKYEQFINFKI